MEGSSKENGWIITWKEWGCTLGQMGGSMRESIKMIKNMVMVYMTGSMEDITRDGGTKENNMDLECTKFQDKS